MFYEASQGQSVELCLFQRESGCIKVEGMQGGAPGIMSQIVLMLDAGITNSESRVDQAKVSYGQRLPLQALPLHLAADSSKFVPFPIHPISF